MATPAVKLNLLNSSGSTIFVVNEISGISSNLPFLFTNTNTSLNSSSGSLIINGGLSISNSINSISVTNGGALTINGGAAIGNDLYVNTNIYTNRISTSSLAAIGSTIGTVYTNIINSSTGILNISGGGLYISNSINSFSNTSGALVINGGVGIGNDLYVNNIYTIRISTSSLALNGITVSNLYTSSSSGILINNGLSILSTTNTFSTTTGALIVNGGVGISNDLYVNNIYNNRISTGSLASNGISVGNLYSNAISSSNLFVSGNVTIGGNLIVLGTTTIVNVTTSNLTDLNITTNSILITTGPLQATFNNNTIGNIFTTGGNIGINTTSPNYTLEISNITTSTMFVNTATMSSLKLNSNLITPSINATNYSGSNIQITNFTTQNAITNNLLVSTGNLTISGGNINVSGSISCASQISSDSFTGATLQISNIGSITNLITTNISIGGVSYFGSSSANIVITGGNLFIGSTISNYQTYIDIATRFTGGSYRIGSMYNGIGNGLEFINIGSIPTKYIFTGSNATSCNINIYRTGGSLSVVNTEYLQMGWNLSDNAFSIKSVRGSNTQTQQPLMLSIGTIGSMIFLSTSGNIGIYTTAPNYTLDINGTCRILGNATVNSLLVSNGSLVISTGSLNVSGNISSASQISGDSFTGSSLQISNQGSISNLISTNMTTSILTTTFISGTNLLMSNITSSNIYSNNIIASNLTGTLISATNLLITNISNAILTATIISNTNFITTNSSIGILTSTLISATNLLTTNVSIGNASIGNIYSNNLTTNNLTTTLVSGTNLLMTNVSFGNASIGNIYSTNLTTNNLTTTLISGTNLLMTNVSSANSSIGNIYSTNISVSNLTSILVSGTNLLMTNVSSANSSIGNMYSSNISVSNLTTTLVSGTNLLITNISSANSSIGNIYSTNISASNLTSILISGTNLLMSNSSIGNISSINISTGTLTGTLVSASNLLMTNQSIGNSSIGNIYAVNESISSLIVSNILKSTFNSNTIGNIIFTTNGNVGINNVAPISPFHYVNTTNTFGSFIIQSTHNVREQLNIRANSNTSAQLLIGIDNLSYFGAIQPVLQGSGFQNLALCYGGGNVGINTTNPNYILDVRGITNISNGTFSLNSTTASLICNSGISITGTNASSATNGGALTIKGGAGILNDVYLGGNLYIQGINNTVITGNVLIGSVSGTGVYQVSITYTRTLANTSYKIIGNIVTTNNNTNTYNVSFCNLTSAGCTANILRLDAFQSGWTDIALTLDYAIYP